MPTIDRWVLQDAVRQLQPHAALLAERPVVFTINLSGQSLDEAEFADFLVAGGRGQRHQPERVLLRAHRERGDCATSPTPSSSCAGCAGSAASVALDDFGTGLSSLAYLRQLPVDMLKIDGSFVRDILKDPRAESMVQAIAHLARSMNLTTVAEYVETDEIRLRVAALGVDYGQGFAIARPVPLTEVLAELPLYAAAEPVSSAEGALGLLTGGLGDGIVVELDDEPPLAVGRSL